MKRILPYTKKEWTDNINDFLETYDFWNVQILGELEHKICDFVGKKYGVAVTSGSVAIMLALYAIKKPGGEIILPNFGYPSAYNACRFLGLKAVPVEIKKDTLCIDPELLKKAINKNTIAVVSIENNSIIGKDILEIKEICRENNVILLEDSAPSMLQKFNGANAGSFGDISVIAFSPGKPLFGGEGGVVLTDDKSIYDKIKDFVHTKYSYDTISLNLSLSPIIASYIIPQFDTLHEIAEMRENCHRMYEENGLDIFEEEGATRRYPSVMYFSENAERIHNRLETFGIGHRYKYFPVIESSPISDEIRNTLIDLPCQQELDDKKVKAICSIIRMIDK